MDKDKNVLKIKATGKYAEIIIAKLADEGARKETETKAPVTLRCTPEVGSV